jgi:hypothetical protein
MGPRPEPAPIIELHSPCGGDDPPGALTDEQPSNPHRGSGFSTPKPTGKLDLRLQSDATSNRPYDGLALPWV